MKSLPNKRHQKGSLLIQLAIVLAVIAMLTAANATDLGRKMNIVLTEGTAQELHMISDAAANYYDQNGQWPNQATNCGTALATLKSAGFLAAGMDANSPFYNATTNPGGQYVFNCGANSFTATVTVKAGWGAQLLSYIGGGTIVGNTITQTTPIPGSYPALDALLPRDGSRPMTGDLDVNGNEINNVDRMEWGSGAEVHSAQGGSMELGNSLTANVKPYVDFHFGTGASQDYNVRIINDANGQLSLLASQVRMSGKASATDFTSTTKNRSLMQSVQDATVVGPNSYVSKPSCGALSPQIFAAPASFAPSSTGAPIQAVQTWAVDSGSQWQVKFRLLTETGWVTPSATYAKIIAFTKCT